MKGVFCAFKIDAKRFFHKGEKMNSKIVPYYLALIASGLLFGLLVFGGKMMNKYGFSMIEVLIIPNLIGVAVLLLISKPQYSAFFKAPPLIGIAYFIAVVMIQIGQFIPLFLGLSVSLTVFLIYTQPLWTTLYTLFKGVKFSYEDTILILLTFVGLIMLIAPWQAIHFSAAGFILALMGGVAMSAWIILNNAYYAKNLKPITVTFFTNLYQSIPFILMIPVFRIFFAGNENILGFNLNHSWIVWLFVVAYTLLVFIGADFLFYKAAEKIRPLVLGLVLLLEPVTAAVLDAVFLDTRLSWNELFGGALILCANAYFIIHSNRKGTGRKTRAARISHMPRAAAPK